MTEKYRNLLCIPEGNTLALVASKAVGEEDSECEIHWFDEVDENFEVISTHSVSDQLDISSPPNRIVTILS